MHQCLISIADSRTGILPKKILSNVEIILIIEKKNMQI